MRHGMVHYLSLTILFITHQSYLFLWYPISSRVLEFFLQKSSDASRVPYIAFLASAYMFYIYGYLYIWSLCNSLGLFPLSDSPFPPPYWCVCLPCHNQFLKRLLKYHQLLHPWLTLLQSFMKAWVHQGTRLVMMYPIWIANYADFSHLRILFL